MVYNDLMLRTIDQRIVANRDTNRVMGTVVSTDTVNLRAMAVFDGSAQAMPVKMAGHVHATEGDRVMIDKYGHDWVIMGSFSRRTYGRSADTVPAQSGSTTSGTYSAIPGAPSYAFVKRWDNTYVTVMQAITAHTDVANTAVGFGVSFNGGTVLDTVPVMMAVAFIHTAAVGAETFAGIPAGTYSVVPHWRRIAGSGSVLHSANDTASLSIAEIEP